MSNKRIGYHDLNVPSSALTCFILEARERGIDLVEVPELDDQHEPLDTMVINPAVNGVTWKESSPYWEQMRNYIGGFPKTRFIVLYSPYGEKQFLEETIGKGKNIEYVCNEQSTKILKELLDEQEQQRRVN